MRTLVLLSALVLFGCGEEDPATACEASGGTIETAECCTSAEDFPDTCMDGPCGCAPEDSHEIQICECPGGGCWDGKECTGGDTGPLPSK